MAVEQRRQRGAVWRHTEVASLGVPDTGSLRGDVLALLRHMSERVGEVAGILSFLIADYFQEAGLPPAVLRERAIAGSQSEMSLILERAVARGEISSGRLSPRISALPVDLVRHDLIMTQRPVPDPTLIEIVDKIFLPLVIS